MKNIYKYVIPERVDVLENNRIRFTQPKYLNDPFDMYLSFKSIISQEEFDKNVNSEIYYEQAIALVKEYLLKNNYPYSYEQLLEIQGKDSDEIRKVFNDNIISNSSIITTNNDLVKNFVYDGMNKSIGVLSLTETPDNIPMWAHYAKVHQGFVFVFNAEHSFFHGGIMQDVDFGKIRKLDYPEEKTVLNTIKEINSGPLYQKHKSWEYEKEWRMLVTLEKKIALKYPDIYLFEIPPEAIQGIIFGYRCDEKLKEYVTNLKADRADLSHLEISEAAPNLDNYKMDIKKIN